MPDVFRSEPIRRDAEVVSEIRYAAEVNLNRIGPAWGGGFPIKVNGEVVGAIGLSGAPTVQNDEDCARAALALVPDAVPTEY